MEVVDIVLDEKDDAQEIFESLNSTGLALEESDKVRNFLLMSLDIKNQEECYKKFWHKIEEHTDYKTTPFIRDYLTIKTRQIPRTDAVYTVFKDYYEKQPACDTEADKKRKAMTDMLKVAEIYGEEKTANFRKSDGQTLKEASKRLREINNLENSVVIPFLLPFLGYAKDNDLEEVEICKVLLAVESYLARRIIKGDPSNALNKVFCTLHQETVRRMERSNEPIASYYNVLAYNLLKKEGRGLFPTDEQIRISFGQRDIYGLPAAAKRFLFERMNNGLIGKEEGVDIVSGMMDKSITIEHIMPQKLTPAWETALGPDYQRIYDQYIDTFANLTLTSYNSNYGNRPFTEKLNGYHTDDGDVIGFKDSSYNLSADIKQLTKWTEEELQDRRDRLTERFLAIFPTPETTFKPEMNNEEHLLSDSTSLFTSHNPISFHLWENDVEVSNWRDLLLKVCATVLEEKPVEVDRLCSRNEKYFYKIQQKYLRKFADGYYVYYNNSADQTIKIVRNLFQQCDIEEAEMTIRLKPEREQTPSLFSN